MSRSGYHDDLASDDPLRYGQWRGRVASAVRGKRGQKLLRDTLAALDAMPEKRLIAHDLINESHEVCTLGACMMSRGLKPDAYDPEDHDGLGKALDVAPCLIQEIEWLNDEAVYGGDDPDKRWAIMRKEIERLIKK